ncbi:hypothetical protein HOLleu_03322 [Holothuria leucospilota]|uniref:Reverse transcriptase n=1 Tax=Holothuria leucospilota TaxID=206669 RepID=A0A9Q1CRG7_HOLLE|nr:hypothetical protein HOLleu_03322 [Holothuria leucospilota]
MPGGRDSTIVKLEFSSGVSVSPPQAFTMLKNSGVEVKEIEMLQSLAARNTYDLKFRSDAARIQGVSCLKALEGLTVTPYDRSAVVTVLYLNFEVDQGLVARVLSQYGTVSDMRWVTYQAGELKGILNGKRQFRMVLKREIPSFLFMGGGGGSKAHIRYFGQPRTCLSVERRGTKPSRVPTDVVASACRWGTTRLSVPTRCGVTSVGRRDMSLSGSCPTSYSARASAEVGPDHEPSQPGPEPMVEEPRSPSPDEGGRITKVENDLQLSSDSETDSAMSDAGGPASEPPPKDPPSGEGWFDLCEGVEPESKLKRSASGEESDQPAPSQCKNKKASTKYAIDRRIRAVRDVRSTVQKDPLDIVEVFKTFYEQLYTQADVDEGLHQSLLGNIDKTPSKEENDGLGSPLTVDELWKAVAKMKGGKAPGSDGIPVEFYKRFWGTVGHDLRDVFASAFLAGSLSPSQRTGVITLLPKSGDPLEPKNKRPITLLNVDYKILAKALCNRLGTVMPDLVGSFQTCAVRGQYSAEPLVDAGLS